MVLGIENSVGNLLAANRLWWLAQQGGGGSEGEITGLYPSHIVGESYE